VSQASFDAWVKYYRQDENTPNATVSYYTKGALVALCLDLSLRAEGHTLDAVMRGLWKRCKAGPMREHHVQDELQALTGRSWQKELQHWVLGTEELPLARLLEAQGIRIHAEPGSFAQHLGLRHQDANGSVQVKAVLRGSAAERAGFAAGDEWLGLEVGARGQLGQWRVSKLSDVPELLGQERKALALVSRDKQLLRLPLTVPQQSTVWRLEAASSRSSGWPSV
jgi:predicted metalloprotease with PDZ domain